MKLLSYSYHEFRKIKNEINLRHYLIFFSPIALILGSAIVNLTLILISLIFIYDLFQNKNLYVKFFKDSWIKIYFIFWVYIIFNSFFSSDQIASLKSSFFQIRYIFFVLFIYQNLNLITFKIFIYIITFCLLFVCIDNNIQFFTGLDIFGFPAESYIFDKRTYQLNKDQIYHIGRLSGPFKDELIAGAYLSKLCFISLIYFFLKFKQKNNFFKIISILYYFFLLESILITGERTSSLIFLIFSLIVILFYFNYKRLIVTLFVLSGLIIFMTQHSEFLKYRVNDSLLIIKDYKNSSYGRLAESGVNLWKKNLFTGVGIKNYRVDCLKIEDPNPDHKFQFCSNHPHNSLLELLSETGLVGTFFFVIFLVSFLKYIHSRLRKKNNRNIKLFSYGLLINLFIIIFPILPSGSLFTTWNATFFWLIFSIILLLTKFEKNKF